MKITNDQIFALTRAGIQNINYAKLAPVDAISIYRLRRDIVAAQKELDKMRRAFIEQVFEPERLALIDTYEMEHKGMTQEEHDAAVREHMPEVQALMVAAGNEEREVMVKPIAFASWLQLLQDNPWLAGFEELLQPIINDEI